MARHVNAQAPESGERGVGAQSAAAADQILLTQAVYDCAQSAVRESEAHDYRLKGFELARSAMGCINGPLLVKGTAHRRTK